MLHLSTSNRIESLVEGLVQVLDSSPADPLRTEVIVVQHPGMGRWISQQIATRAGIAANLEFVLPASFIWQVLELSLKQRFDSSLFSQPVLSWRIVRVLKDIERQPAMAVVRQYLKDDPEGDKRFALADKLASLFDRYLIYRPRMILDWEQGKQDGWQSLLWQALSSDPREMHWARLLRRFFEAADRQQLDPGNLPERICFFGISALAPGYLRLIERLAELTEIHLFHFSPSDQAWDDIRSSRELARTRKTLGDEVAESDLHFDSGNPLLASMGRAGREFFGQLVELQPGTEHDLYTEPAPNTLLDQVQADVMQLHDRGQSTEKGPLPDQHTIRFHSCHSPLREVQVLHDRLLDRFAADPSLRPADILVMAPDISIYAPYIGGIFGANEDTLQLPWSISDLPEQLEHPVIDSFIRLLELGRSRFTAAEIMALLETRSVRIKFGFDQAAIESIRTLVGDVGIRWGLDARQRRQIGLDDSYTHTWAFGVERLLLGYMTGASDVPIGCALPYDGHLDGAADWLGGLASFVDKLQQLHADLSTHHAPEAWGCLLESIIDSFFDDSENSPDLEGIGILRKTISAFRSACEQAGYEESISVAVVRQVFLAELRGMGYNRSFLNGKIDFCSLSPLRSFPARVICLLGMNDTAYPHSQHPPEFDLIAKKREPGDPDRREADRYLFLETLLQARDHLHISWVGQNQLSNETQPPSVLVSELLDYIDRGWRHPSDPTRGSSDCLLSRHPLQPFSRHCFDPDRPHLGSYNDLWLPRTCDENTAQFLPAPLESPGEQFVPTDLDELVRFWKHPARYFLSARLGLSFWEDEHILEEAEAFSLDSLQRYKLIDELISIRLDDQPVAPLLMRAQAAGELPGGEAGEVYIDELLSTSDQLVTRLSALTAQPREQISINIPVADTRLDGRLRELYAAGRVSYRAARFGPHDLLQLWIRHLVLLILGPDDIAPVSTHVAADATYRLAGVDEPLERLNELVVLYQRGLNRPLHFFPRSALAWASAKSTTAKMNQARNTWYGGRYQLRAEHQDPAYDIALRGVDEPLDEAFVKLSGLFDPMLAHLKKDDADA